jgi:hypothetical protein
MPRSLRYLVSRRGPKPGAWRRVISRDLAQTQRHHGELYVYQETLLVGIFGISRSHSCGLLASIDERICSQKQRWVCLNSLMDQNLPVDAGVAGRLDSTGCTGEAPAL